MWMSPIFFINFITVFILYNPYHFPAGSTVASSGSRCVYAAGASHPDSKNPLIRNAAPAHNVPLPFVMSRSHVINTSRKSFLIAVIACEAGHFLYTNWGPFAVLSPKALEPLSPSHSIRPQPSGMFFVSKGSCAFRRRPLWPSNNV